MRSGPPTCGTQLLDEPHRARLSKLLIDYTDNRIKLGTASGDQKADLASNDRLLTEIWAAVMAARDSANRAWHHRPPSTSRSTS